jgi:hypothetical protein
MNLQLWQATVGVWAGDFDGDAAQSFEDQVDTSGKQV